MTSPLQPAPPTPTPGLRGLIAGSAAALTVMVLLPCFVPTTPVRYFESDPRMGLDLGLGGDTPLTELGPAAVAWLQTLTAIVAGVGLIVAIAAGARLSKVAVLLTGLGMAAALFHMISTAARWEDWTQGGAWIAAAMTGLAAMHLGQHEAGRRWIVALCVAAALPLLAEAGWYVWVEHPESVRFFETHRDEILAARGMTLDSEAAALYERRLRFADATGTFGLSNVLASVAAAIGLAGAGVFISTWVGRKRQHARWVIAASALATAAAVLVVWLTTSKGAVVAIAAAAGLAVLVLVATRWRRAQAWLPVVALGLVALAIGAVLVRGAMGPPAPPVGGFVADAAIDGERSLLFRFHYWSAAADIAADSPILGSGSRGFADAYPAAKNPLNPESVTSTHNVLIDQITMLGVGGWAWSGLLLWWLWGAARSAGSLGNIPDESDDSRLADTTDPTVPRSAVWGAVAAAVVVFGLTLGVRQSSLYLDSALVWLVGIAGFVGVAAVLGSAGLVTPRGQRLALLLAATVVLVHNQIEMAFFQPTSMGLLWLVVGAAGAGAVSTRAFSVSQSASPQATPPAPGKFIAAGGLGLVIVVVMMFYAVGVGHHERAMAGAEAALRRGDHALAVDRLAEAQHAAGLDTPALRWRVQLHALEPMSVLVNAGRSAEAQRRVEEALNWIDESVATEPTEPPPTPIARLRASLLGLRATQTRIPQTWAEALTAYAALAERSPYNIQDRLAWADLAWQAGDRDEAIGRYAEVLELREQKYLDAADPLTPEQLSRVRAVLTAVDASGE